MITDLEPSGLYHLATPVEWADHQKNGIIDTPSLDAEGFIHCSWGTQVEGTVQKHFAGVEALVALKLDPEVLGSKLIEEDSYGSGQKFPHCYGPIAIRAVLSVVQIIG